MDIEDDVGIGVIGVIAISLLLVLGYGIGDKKASELKNAAIENGHACLTKDGDLVWYKKGDTIPDLVLEKVK